MFGKVNINFFAAVIVDQSCSIFKNKKVIILRLKISISKTKSSLNKATYRVYDFNRLISPYLR